MLSQASRRTPRPELRSRARSLQPHLLPPMLVLALAGLVVGCDAGGTIPGAAATAARAAATPIARPIRTPVLSAPVTVTSPPGTSTVSLGTATPARDDASSDALSQQSIAETRRAFEQAVSSPGLRGIEVLLLGRVSITSRTGGEVLERDGAVRWLRQRSGPNLRLTQFDRHHHVPLLVAVTEGWRSTPPIITGRVGFSFHRYDPAGHQDDQYGQWKVDLISAE